MRSPARVRKINMLIASAQKEAEVSEKSLQAVALGDFLDLPLKTELSHRHRDRGKTLWGAGGTVT